MLSVETPSDTKQFRLSGTLVALDRNLKCVDDAILAERGQRSNNPFEPPQATPGSNQNTHLGRHVARNTELEQDALSVFLRPIVSKVITSDFTIKSTARAQNNSMPFLPGHTFVAGPITGQYWEENTNERRASDVTKPWLTWFQGICRGSFASVSGEENQIDKHAFVHYIEGLCNTPQGGISFSVIAFDYGAKASVFSLYGPRTPVTDLTKTLIYDWSNVIKEALSETPKQSPPNRRRDLGTF